MQAERLGHYMVTALEADNRGEAGAEQMLEPKRVKSDGRQRLQKEEPPLGMWSGSAAGLRTQRTLFPKSDIFSVGRKREVCR